VLHAGDLFSRGEPITACSGGLANLEILERMGVDALTPGNGEFYFGVENLVEQTSRVNFPVLHANVVHRHTGTPLLPAYTIKEISGVRVAILGLGVVRMGHYSARDLEWLQPIEVAKRYVPVLRPQADLLIVLSHLGLATDRALAAAVPEIDLIVGGHSHTRLDVLKRVPRPPDPVAIGIVQAGGGYEFVGRVDVRMRSSDDGYTVDALDGRLLPVTATVPGDPAVQAVLAYYAVPFSDTVGTLESGLVAAREGPSPLTDFAAEAIRTVTRSDLSMVWRFSAWPSFEAGPVTVSDICRVHPDREPVLTARVKGWAIGDLARTRNLMFSGGDVEDSTVVRIDGAAVDTLAYYTLAAPLSAFTQIEALQHVPTSRTGYRVDTAIERYFRQRSVVP
jgi:2',3'-cyclic-nucleotide 2'-phosphodiesterase (5'-nucleotidase family)